MRASTRRIWGGLGAVALCGLMAALYFSWQLALIGAAYKAKTLCSGVFVSQRDVQSVLATDLQADDLWPLAYFDAKVDFGSQVVTATLGGVVERKAVYRPGVGCVLTYDDFEPAYRFASVPDRSASISRTDRDRLWPLGDRVEAEPAGPEADAERLDAALDGAFSEPNPPRLRRMRAVVVVHRGRIVAERYAPGFTAATPLIGYSMTKSVINALAGVLVKEGVLSLREPVPVREWQEPGDPRSRITLDHLLRMSSGLSFEEDYRNPLEDVTFMLLAVPDMAAYAAGKPLEADPGTKWHYSSGTTNIIARVLCEAVGSVEGDVLAFPRHVLFDRIGMRSALIEPDASGTPVGSSFMYASARDWARFGLLYVRDGTWQGERILPQGWVEYTRTPTPQAPEGMYGAHFWLKVHEAFRGDPKESPALPADAFHAIGYEGQFVTIVPSRDLVIVRPGLTRRPGAWNHQAFVAQVLKAISGRPPHRRASSFAIERRRAMGGDA